MFNKTRHFLCPFTLEKTEVSCFSWNSSDRHVGNFLARLITLTRKLTHVRARVRANLL